MMIMNIQQLLKTGANVASNNAPALLTAFGTVGTVTTAVLAGKASFQAADKVRELRLEKADAVVSNGGVVTDDNYKDIKPDTLEVVKAVWPLYLSTVFSGAATCTAIVLAHRISARRAAVLAAAYALNEGKLEEYQDKIKEKFGVKEEKEARDELAQEKVNRDYDENPLIFNDREGKVLLKDEYSGRYFYGDIEDVNRAVNEINHEILRSMGSSATLSAFYDLIGLENVSTSDYVGWNTSEMLEIDWSTCTTPDKKHAVHVFEFVNPPILNPGDNASFR